MSISRLFYEMSSTASSFKLMADVYPKRINIDPSQAYSWGEMNRKVFEEFKKTNPTFDWSKYDQRTNRPEYLFDNSLSAPDQKPDYVIICYRYEKSWAIQPAHDMNTWAGSGGGISILEGIYDFEFNEKYTISSDGFHMNTVGVQEPENFRRLFQHELGHELLSCPHHFSGTLGNYFRSTVMGWGTSVGSASCTRLLNAWERWVLGWIDIKHDLKGYKDNGTYTIDDFATTGDAIRIKIPHTESQYLWIENHQLKNIFDQSRWIGSLKDYPPGSAGMTNIDTGLFFFVEDMMPDRSKISSDLVYDMNAINGAKFLNANGNWDYATPTKVSRSWSEYWNNILYVFERKEENPYDGINPFMCYRFDADSNGAIANSHDFNHPHDTEQFTIVKEQIGDTSFLFYGNHGCTNRDALPYRRTHSFVSGDVLSLCSNPPLTNNPKYNFDLNQLEPVYINGLKIEILKEVNGKYTLSIFFDNNLVTNDLRLSGNLVLKNIENTEIDFSVSEKITLLVNKSNTINTFKYNNNTFINETQWVIDSAHVALKKSSKLFIQDSSSVLFKTNSTLSLQESTIIAEEKALLVFQKDSEIIADKTSVFSCLDAAIVRFEKGAKINQTVVLKEFVLEHNKSIKTKKLLKILKKENKKAL